MLMKEKMIQFNNSKYFILGNEIDCNDYIEIIQKISKILRAELKNSQKCILLLSNDCSAQFGIASYIASICWSIPLYLNSSNIENDTTGTFQFQKPNPIHIKILKIIEKMMIHKYRQKLMSPKDHEQFIYKKDLVKILYQKGIIQVKKRNSIRANLLSSIYMNGRKYFIALKNEYNYITIPKTKRKRIFLTQNGRIALRIFKYLLPL
jgi:hypothetical protein